MARINRLTVRGFKSIRTLDDFELCGLNVLIGANGAGKSNLLGVFRMIEQLSVKRLQLFVADSGGADGLLFGGRGRTKRMSADLVLDGGRHRYGFSLEAVGSDRMAFGGESMLPGVSEFVGEGAGDTFRTVDGGIEWPGGHEEARLADCGIGDLAAYVLPEMRRWRVFHFQDVSRCADVRRSSTVRDNLRLKGDASNLAPFLRSLRERHPVHYRRVVDAVRMVAPFFGDLVYREGLDRDDRLELEWFHGTDRDTVIGPEQISDGTLRFSVPGHAVAAACRASAVVDSH